MTDKFHEECGVVGVYGHPEAANLAYLGLYALQHRGQESAGIVASNGEALIVAPRHGARRRRLQPGHPRAASRAGWRSATTATRPPARTVLKNASRSSSSTRSGALAVAHNGNLVNADELRERLEARGSIFQSTSDTEVIVHLIAASSGEHAGRTAIVDALRAGARRLLAGLPDRERDDRGARSDRLPAARARARRATRCVVASETCALDLIDADVRARGRAGRDRRASTTTGVAVATARSRRRRAPLHLRVRLLRAARLPRSSAATSTRCARSSAASSRARAPSTADVVIPVPDSGVPAAHRLRRGGGPPVRDGAHPQPLRRAHVHRAAAARSATSA